MKKRIRTLLFFIMALCFVTKVSAETVTINPSSTNSVGFDLSNGFFTCSYFTTGTYNNTLYRFCAQFDYSIIPAGSTNISSVLSFASQPPYVCPTNSPITLDVYDAQYMNGNCDGLQFNSDKGTNDGSVTFNWYDSFNKNVSLGSRQAKYISIICHDEANQYFYVYPNMLKLTITYTPPAPTIPAPTGLTLKSYSCNTLNVGWNAVTGATSYAVYLNGVKQTTVSSNSVTLSGLNTGTSYNITVTATTSAGTSSQSAVLAATPALPTILTFNTDLSASSKLGVASQEVDLDPGFDFIGTTANTFEAYTSTTCPASKLAVVRESDLTEEVDNSQSDNASKAPEVTNSCFPNPTHGEFTVRMNLPEHQTSEIRVYDSMGKLVKSVVASSTETLVSIEDQPAGIYFVRYTVDGKDQSAKIVKL
jgi:Secretion system C-terminal sorting domain